MDNVRRSHILLALAAWLECADPANEVIASRIVPCIRFKSDQISVAVMPTGMIWIFQCSSQGLLGQFPQPWTHSQLCSAGRRNLSAQLSWRLGRPCADKVGGGQVPESRWVADPPLLRVENEGAHAYLSMLLHLSGAGGGSLLDAAQVETRLLALCTANLQCFTVRALPQSS